MYAFNPLAKILDPGAKVFEQAKEGDAGFDVWAYESGVIPSQGMARFRTGIATAFQPNWVGLILDRGGWGFKGLMRQAGVVDSNYRDEWLVQIYNSSGHSWPIEGVKDNPKAKALCQVVFCLCATEPFKVVDVLPSSIRQAAFGSSDHGSAGLTADDMFKEVGK